MGHNSNALHTRRVAGSIPAAPTTEISENKPCSCSAAEVCPPLGALVGRGGLLTRPASAPVLPLREKGPLGDGSVPDLLRAIRSDIAESKQDESKQDTVEVKPRLGILEAQHPSLSRRVNRIGSDVERTSRRLDLAEAPAAP